MTREAWLKDHPYLEPVANLEKILEDAAAATPAAVPVPDLAPHAPERANGVPLLRSEVVSLDLTGAGQLFSALVDALASAALPEKLGEDARAVKDLLRVSPGYKGLSVRWASEGAPAEKAPATPQVGLLRYLAWRALRSALAPVVAANAAARGEEGWTQPYCPTCGAPPVMTQLSGPEGNRRRLLACGACGDRWGWKRIGCPYCDNEDGKTIDLLMLDAEPDLGIQICQACKGYLKIYRGDGQEALYLLDWPTLHLDAIAKEQGAARKGASLYDL
jgi:FdhE protein